MSSNGNRPETKRDFARTCNIPNCSSHQNMCCALCGEKEVCTRACRNSPALCGSFAGGEAEGWRLAKKSVREKKFSARQVRMNTRIVWDIETDVTDSTEVRVYARAKLLRTSPISEKLERTWFGWRYTAYIL